jgi:hypothetical protein
MPDELLRKDEDLEPRILRIGFGRPGNELIASARNGHQAPTNPPKDAGDVIRTKAHGTRIDA